MIKCDICLKVFLISNIKNLRKDKDYRYGGKDLKKLITKLLKITLIAILLLELLMFLLKIDVSHAESSLTVQGRNTAETIWLTLTQIYGYTDISTAAIMGNLQYESGLRSNNAENLYVGNNTSGTEDKDIAYTNMMNNNRAGFCDKDVAWNGATNGSSLSGKERDGYVGYGLAQWTWWSRKAVLWDMAHEAGVSIDDVGIQLKVLDYELCNGYKACRDAMQATSDLTVATTAFLKQYEKPADQSDTVVAKRTAAALSYYNTYSGSTYSDGSVTIETNCNEMVVIKKDNIYLYKEPKTSANSVATLQNGQVVTRINNSGQYVENGKIFDGILLATGKKGFVLRENLNTTDFSKVYKVKTSSGNGVNVRAGKSTSSTRVTGIDEGGLVTVLEKGTTLENGYYWSYVTAPDGIKGYVASNLLEKLTQDTPTTPEDPDPPTPSNNSFAIDETNKLIKMIPSVDYATLKNTYSDVVVKKADGAEVTSGLIGTGYKITTGGKTYTAIKLGDVNGDGDVDTVDRAMIKRFINNTYTLSGDYKNAGDINRDNDVDTVDRAMIKRFINGTYTIEIK